MKINENALYAIGAICLAIIFSVLIIYQSHELPKYRPVAVKGEIVSITPEDNLNNFVIKVTDVLDDDQNVVDFLMGTSQKTYKSNDYEFTRGDKITISVDIPIKYDYNNLPTK